MAGEDLAAAMSRVQRALEDGEAPILRGHGLSMWEYVILLRVSAHGPLSQKDLARLSRRDPTRLGANLEDLGGRGLIRRDADAEDRRRHVVLVTDAGAALVDRVRGDVATMERELLGDALPALRRALTAASDRIDAAG